MRKMLFVCIVFGATIFVLHVSAEDKPQFTLHVTHVKFEDRSDKPAENRCNELPCTTGIFTVEAHSAQVNFVLECKQWMLVGEPIKYGKCWALEAGKDYDAKRSARRILFYDDTFETDPVYFVMEESERKK